MDGWNDYMNRLYEWVCGIVDGCLDEGMIRRESGGFNGRVNGWMGEWEVGLEGGVWLLHWARKY